MLQLLFPYAPGIVIFAIVIIALLPATVLARRQSWPTPAKYLIGLLFLWATWEILHFSVMLTIEDWQFSVPVRVYDDANAFTTVTRPAPGWLQPVVQSLEFVTSLARRTTAGWFMAGISMLVVAIRLVRNRSAVMAPFLFAGLNVAAIIGGILITVGLRFLMVPLLPLNALPGTAREVQLQYLFITARMVIAVLLLFGLYFVQAKIRLTEPLVQSGT